ncbi:GDP-L-fucose synthase [Candidatus Berkelbacteria bacterium]|nr:GDP-L-fucose synthase [Candidatus Berkelbacteria bacterium]
MARTGKHPNPASTKQFWRGKRILVTGGRGFVGSWVVEELKTREPGEILTFGSNEYDLTEQSQVRALLADTKPDIVIHLAARVGGIGANRAHPGKFFYDNMIMGAMLMEEARKAGVEKFTNVGTVCAYPKFTPVPFKEDDLWNGYPEETNAPYGIAKKALLVQAQAYRAEYGFNAIYLLPVNQYGPRDVFHETNAHVIPDLIRKMVDAEASGTPSITLWGDGSPTREFIYVADTARAIVLATERYNQPEPVNIGASFEISIKDLAELIATLTGFSGQILWDTSQPNGQPRRKLDVSRAREFGFEAKVGFEEGLRATIDWYRNERRVPAPAPRHVNVA